MQIVPLRLCHIGTKKSVLWPSKYAKIRFRPGLCPDPVGGAEDDAPTYPIPRGTNQPSALAMRPPEFQPDLRL